MPSGTSCVSARVALVVCCMWPILVVGCSSCFGPKHRQDETMIEHFEKNRRQFEELLVMFTEDRHFVRIGRDFTVPERTVGGDLQRLEEYRKYFKELGLEAGIQGDPERTAVHFHATTYGLSVTGSSKGYAHLASTPSLVVDNLDEFWSENGESFTAFRHIDENWYLYFDYED